ncbi:peptidoglycan recognition protein family protein [Peribacillus loiseleuriae]|uniref:peptidoglycan recognition protein family protein n=1 Tax=Peribacillus loiseleuriae TaxID=1679170 RepID=UPI00069F7E04|nr:peptidoglycan recognition family protein [Peribacillus loiseleuriae]
MAINDLPKYKDIRGSIRRNGRYPVVGTAIKDTHVVHHSMTAQHLKGSTPQAFANTHIDTNKWPGIAYAFVIMPDGTIYQCDDLDRRTYHAGDINTRSIGTCLVGDFRKEGAAEKPTAEQMQSLYLLNKELYKVLSNMKITLGHQECPGYAWKNCPGDTWNYKDVISGKILISEKKEEPKVAERDIDKVSDWAKKDWEEAIANGYFDGTRPGSPFTREEAAIVINRLRKNLLELISK